jgi:capsular polysaccharide transport system permease protein
MLQETTITTRTPWQVTKSVWHALFLREALSRTTLKRFAWFWMLAEPVATISIFISVRTVLLGKSRHIAGAEFIPWMIVGLFGYYLFRENMFRSIGAIDANKALFTYRQVKPIDPVLVRCYLEGMLKSVIFFIFVFLGALLEIPLIPELPIHALFSWISLWALGLGAALTFSALSELAPETGRIIKLTSLPLMLISGVIIPINYIPHELQQYLLLNPIVHGLEHLRKGFFEEYNIVTGANLTYLWHWALSFISLGLILHLKFELRLKAK